MSDGLIFFALAMTAIALLWLGERITKRRRMIPPRQCPFCKGIDGRHASNCVLHHYRGAA